MDVELPVPIDLQTVIRETEVGPDDGNLVLIRPKGHKSPPVRTKA